MSEPKILELMHTVGMHISAGQLSDFLMKDQEQFHAEREAVVRAGLTRSPWQHLDSTGTRVDDENEQCHVLCNPFSTAYCTLPAKDRLSLLRVLMGGADLAFRLNERALSLLKQLGVAQKWCQKLTTLLPHEQEWNENKLDDWLDEHLPTLGAKLRKLIKYAGLKGREDRRTAIAAGVVGGESIIFLGNRCRCPLTGLAENLGAASGSVTDISLPGFLASHLVLIHVPLLALVLYLHVRNFLRRSRA